MSYELAPYGSGGQPATRKGRQDLKRVQDGHAAQVAQQESRAQLAASAIAQGYNMVDYATARSAASHRSCSQLAGGDDALEAHLNGMVAVTDTAVAFKIAEHVRRG